MLFLVKKVLPVLLLVVVGAVGAVAAMKFIPGLSLFGSTTETSNTQVIKAVNKEEQVVLVSLGVQAMYKHKAKGQILGTDVPMSERILYIPYNFKAKLGVEGRDVKIKKTGENDYLITAPRFIFIGHDEIKFDDPITTGEAFSFTAPELKELEAANKILDPKGQQGFIAGNETLLRDQFQAFYSRIIMGIDPTITVKFDFAG